jgi:biotin carboxyl carrier protein
VKLKAIIGEQQEDVELEVDGARVSAWIGARHYQLEARETEPGVFLFFVGNTVREFRVDARARERIKIIDPKRLRGGKNSDGHQHGVAEIVAQMPGKVVRVHVEKGTPVEKGAGIIVVEAMKMQNEMKAPRAGMVVALNVEPGDTVNAGDLLAVLE